MNFTRLIRPAIAADLESKIVMIGGPRQVGKTTLARTFLSRKEQYLTWDDLDDREILKRHQLDRLSFDSALGIVALDEIHKYRRWRTLLKGTYDTTPELKIIVTGSDHFRKGGDSLFGRFFYYRLHPLSYSELLPHFGKATLSMLERFGGFPEPLLKGEERFLRRWHRERRSRVVLQDISDLQLVRDTSLLELLVDLLPSRVGSLLSIRSLQEDLEVSPNTVTSWLELLEKVYYCFRIVPYGPPKVRAVKKTNKLYLWDWSEVEAEGPRRENLVASHLLKYCHWKEDTEGHRMELRYFRDVDGREVDFVVLQDKKPVFAVEVKSGEHEISRSLRYFAERTPIPTFYQLHFGSKAYQQGRIQVLPFARFCSQVLEGV